MFQVPVGERCCRVKTFNSEDKNCSTVNYYQCGRASVTKCCMSELLVQLLDEPAFNALRTREQLGYDVTCQRRTTYNTLGFLITVSTGVSAVTRPAFGQLTDAVSSHTANRSLSISKLFFFYPTSKHAGS